MLQLGITDMKNKSILLAVLVGSAGVVSADSYLYWMIDTLNAGNDYAYARIRDVNTSGDASYLTIYDGSFEETYSDGVGGVSGAAKEYIDLAASVNDGFFASLAGINLSTASFIVELYNDSGNFLAQSFNNLNYSAASAYIYSGGISVPSAKPWIAISFDIPEPSSGLLMLLGMAGLALRRRKNV